MINELLILILSIIFIMYILPKRMENQYRIDKEGRTVFYPLSFSEGYILDDPNLIKQASKNLIWKHNFIKTIFAHCETTNIPLNQEIVRQNIAKNSKWSELWIILIISTLIAIKFFLSKLYILAILCFLLTYPHIKLLCIKKSQEQDEDNNVNNNC